MNEPKTVTQQLDAAQTGEEFGAAILGLLSTLERMKDDDNE